MLENATESHTSGARFVGRPPPPPVCVTCAGAGTAKPSSQKNEKA